MRSADSVKNSFRLAFRRRLQVGDELKTTAVHGFNEFLPPAAVAERLMASQPVLIAMLTQREGKGSSTYESQAGFRGNGPSVN